MIYKTLSKISFLFIMMMGLVALGWPASNAQAQTPEPPEAGTLEFVANGEDFIRQGFVSKDGWEISFEHVYVNLAGITAYQTDPPYDPDLSHSIEAETSASLAGPYWVDLAEGGAEADPIFVDAVEAPPGQYNALAWQMVPAAKGDYAGYALVMIGTAEQDGETIDFTIGIEAGYDNACGEFVGEVRKGILQAGDSAEVEMTFHFDHIFGDAELPADDSLNELAPGFGPFASVAEDGVIETDLAALQEALTEDEYQMLVDILPTLGHTGEGHCSYEEIGSLEFVANGEDFIRRGFVSKDGWEISFDNVYVNLSDITAYQTDPPYDPDEAGLHPETTVSLSGTYRLDLAEGNAAADPIFVEAVTAPLGHYNALSWQMVPDDETGYSVLMVGSAEKEGERVEFTIGVENSYNNLCGEFVGDVRKGIVQRAGSAELEMTFHFDHIFGDAELPADDSLNELAPGFGPFASVAEDGVVETDLAALEESLPEDEHQMLVDILPTLGHTGEGHCYYGETGALEFVANGEDFIRQGFVSKDGWTISFDTVNVNLTDITAYQTDPPYDPDENQGQIEADVMVQLAGPYRIDLAEGGPDAAPLPVDTLIVPAGQYNALSWQMVPAAEGDDAGYALVMRGTAEKDGETVDFTIGVENEYSNLCGEYVGDVRKGIVMAGGSAELEMTFHFDHIFGDADLPADDGLNELAPGFAPFASVADAGVVETDLAALEESLPEDEYQLLVDILPTLGHTGEGHCYYGQVSE